MANLIITKPLLALRGILIFPGMIANIDVGREKSMAAIDAAELTDKQIILVGQKQAEQEDVTAADLYEWGVLATIKQKLQLPNGAVRLLVEGLERVHVLRAAEVHENEQDFFVGEVEVVPADDAVDAEAEGLRRLLLDAFEQWVLLTKKVNPDTVQSLKSRADVSKVPDIIVGYLTLSLTEKEELLEMAPLKLRLRKLYEILVREQEIADVAKNISEQVHQQVEQNQKEYYLREQIKAISKELGENEDVQAEIAEYKEQMSKLKMPQNVAEKINKELGRLAKMPPMTPEGAVIRTYIDSLLALPWGKFTKDNFDIDKAQDVLDKDHYGLKKVKERILEYLAVRALSKSTRGPILCLVGPPGVGKTSLASSIAKAIKRKFTRISLGGVRDEAEIRGHRRTYIGSMPGRIIHGMQTCGCMNPVFLLDEIDKMASDFRGDPASALLEVLDPEQNNSFSDHFIEFPFDLSHVFWIVTANAVDTIPPALLDRLEIIQLSSYTDEEKVKIAQLHLLPKELKLNGLEKYKVSVSEKAIRRVIHDYTREAGVRNLERKLAGICRKVAFKIVKGKGKGAQVTEKNLEKYLGPVIYLDDDISLKSSVGVANGLAWTSVGGELLKVEVLAFKGKGNLTLTGQLGDVMKESAQAGYTYIRSRAEALGIPANFGETMDIHIHLPEGAVPKDGPSAGVTMVTAMVSALTGKKVKGKLAMTGEISLSGKVWPVGGIKEKMLAAYRYGVKTVLLPKRNMQDLDELPENIRKEMQFIPVEHLDDVLKLALEDKNE
ncbi:lon protease [Phascolarctobacterium succinatutens CAG:287]|uniref:Lon protease n=1 Tax=Phascolarctobacterium succinatutens CAG:287 TaxID=1263101 RepID=R6XYM5_9FIRM|nr:endopeptidase La [Phascolarctobacterium succinatutens]CDD11332.1 lon protease [Phascolarctobacterium succinatutens CAG:287]